MTAFVILAAGGFLSWLLRVAFIGVVPPKRLPALVHRALESVGPAAMAALIATELSHRVQTTAPDEAAVALAAAVVAGVVAWKTKRPTLTVGVGIGAYWLLQIVAP